MGEFECLIPVLEEQSHLLAGWETWKDDIAAERLSDGQRSLLTQLKGLDSKYVGGLTAYRLNAIGLLKASAAGDNPLEGFVPSIPMGETLTAHTEAYRETERLGLEAAGTCGFVLVAGGLGERLGFGGIKVALPTESTSGTCYLKHYIEGILALEARAGKGKKLPLAIMLSGDTYDLTVALLKENGNFGMSEDQVTLMLQDKVPSICDNEGRFVLSGDGASIETKPHGHGDVHALMFQHGLAQKWLDDGLSHVFFFQDTNGFAIRSCVANLGVSKKLDLDVNSSCVARKPGEAIGAICKLENATSDPPKVMTLNVEYNQLGPLLKATVNPDGDVADETGNSPYPGNINQLLYKLDGENGYAAVLRRSSGAIPEFVNPKYADDTKTTFKKPTRLECMMQDYPKLLGPTARVGFTVLERAAVREYSPVKNATADAVLKIKNGLSGACPATGEADMYAFNCDLLGVGGMKVADAVDAEFLDVPVKLRPQVCLTPFFGLTEDHFVDHVKGGELGANSSLIIEGPGKVVLDNLVVKPGAALRVTTGQGTTLTVKDLVVDNKGTQLVKLTEDEVNDPSVPEATRIRGFKVVEDQVTHLVFTQPGEFTA